jgi:hypothetical protein
VIGVYPNGVNDPAEVADVTVRRIAYRGPNYGRALARTNRSRQAPPSLSVMRRVPDPYGHDPEQPDGSDRAAISVRMRAADLEKRGAVGTNRKGLALASRIVPPMIHLP